MVERCYLEGVNGVACFPIPKHGFQVSSCGSWGGVVRCCRAYEGLGFRGEWGCV